MSANSTEETKQHFAIARVGWSASAALGALAAILFATAADNTTLAFVFGGFALLSVGLALTFRRE